MSKKVLLCDDSLLITMRIKDIINKYDDSISVFALNNGEDALKVFNENKTDLILLDIVMPEITGLELLEKMMQIDSSRKVFMISSVGTSDNIKQALDLGAKGFIQKPVKEEDIINILDYVFKK